MGFLESWFGANPFLGFVGLVEKVHQLIFRNFLSTPEGGFSISYLAAKTEIYWVSAEIGEELLQHLGFIIIT